jgi:ankyrin repeat protein
MAERANLFLNAVKHGEAQTVRRLLAEDPSLVGLSHDDGSSPLALAARTGRLEVLRALLEAGAARRPEGDPAGPPTALMQAAAAGQAEAVSLLLRHGADPALRDRDGRTAADHAQEGGHDDLAARLAAANSGGASPREGAGG